MPTAAATAFSADGRPEFGSCDGAAKERFCHTPAPMVAPTAAGAAAFLADKQRQLKMPVYQLALNGMGTWWDKEAARRYAKFLIRKFASSGFYSSRFCLLEVKDESGNTVAYQSVTHPSSTSPNFRNSARPVPIQHSGTPTRLVWQRPRSDDASDVQRIVPSPAGTARAAAG